METSDNIESRILRLTPIMRYQKPPMWEAWGGLKYQTVPLPLRIFCTDVSSMLTQSALQASAALIWALTRSDMSSHITRVHEDVLNYFNMYGSCSKTGDEQSPSLTLCKISPCATRDNGPWIHTYIRKGKTRLKTVRMKVSHLLYFILPTQLPTFQARMN